MYLTRTENDVTKTGDYLGPSGTITYTMSIKPDITGMDMVYTIIDTLPDGTTDVPGSV